MKKITILLVSILLLSGCGQSNNIASVNPPATENETISTGNMSQQVNPKDTFIQNVLKEDTLFYRLDDNYIINNGGQETKIPVKKNGLNEIRQYQAFLSDDGTKIYYNTDFNDKEGRLFVYDINKKESYDLLDQLGIKIDGYIAVFSYKNNKIGVIIGRGQKNKEGSIEKRETEKILEIDLNTNSHKYINLPFKPYATSLYRGFCILGENYLICSSGYSTDNRYNQSIVIVNSQGQIIKELPLHENVGIYHTVASPDNKRFTYQLGQTPDSLYLYDIETEQKQTIFDAKEHEVKTEECLMCIYSNWGDKTGSLYYISMNYGKTNRDEMFSLLRKEN